MKFKEKLKHPLAGFLIFGVALLLIPVLYPVLTVTLRDSLARTLVYFIVALGFSLLIGYAGLASLGSASFIAVGTFTVYSVIDVLHLPFIVAIILGIVIAVILGALFGIVSLRIEGMYLAIVTLGLAEIMTEIFKNLDKFTGGVSGTSMKRIVMFGSKLSDRSIFIIIIIAVVIAMILTYNLINSQFGRALLSIKNNQSAAQAMGISVIKYRMIAFIVSTVYAVLGGILMMTFTKYSISSYWGLAISLNLLAAVVLGGSKSIWGVLIGTFLIFGLDLVVFKGMNLFSGRWQNLSLIINGTLIIVVVMFYPNGLMGLFKELYYKFKKRRVKKDEQT